MGVDVRCQPSWAVSASPWFLTSFFAYKKKKKAFFFVRVYELIYPR